MGIVQKKLLFGGNAELLMFEKKLYSVLRNRDALVRQHVRKLRQ